MSETPDPGTRRVPLPRRHRAGLLTSLLAIVAASVAVFATSSPAGASGGLSIEFRDASGDPVSGACYDIWTEVGGDVGEIVRSLCNTSGSNVIQLPAGPYRIWETQPPLLDAQSNSHLYRKAPITPVTVTDGGTTTVVLTHEIGAAIDVTSLLPGGDPANGSCFVATAAGEQVADACAPSGGNTAALIVPAATGVTVSQLSGRDGYGVAPDAPVAPRTGDTRTAITMTMLEGSAIEITQRAAGGEVVPGGCYAFYAAPAGGTETFVEYQCDYMDPAGENGVVVLQVEPGRYRAVEEHAPDGYRVNGEEFFVDVTSGATQRVDRSHEPLALLGVVSVDGAEQPIAGSCWKVHYPGEYEGYAAEGCDADDGADDGTWTVPDLEPGSYELRHMSTPGYERLEELQAFDIDATDVTLTIQLSPLQAPANTELPVITGELAVGAALTATDGTWTGSEPLRLFRQWQSCDAAGANCAPIAGASSPTFTPAAAHVGRTIRIAVTATNDAASAVAVSAATAELVARPPVSQSPPTVTGDVAVGNTLTGVNGTWGGDPSQFASAWLRCDADGNACVEIPGATRTTYTLTTADSGARLRYRVTATNAGGSVAAQSAATTAVPGSAPELVREPMIVRIFAFYIADPGEWRSTNGELTFAYQWMRCDLAGNGCRPIDGATAQMIGRDNRYADVSLRVRVVATNGGGSTEAWSAPFELGPTNLTAPMLSGNARVGDVITASRGLWTPANGISQYIYTWLRCDAAGNGCYALHGYAVASSTYRLTAEDIGHTIRVDVNARNAEAGRRSQRSSATAVVERHTPISVTPPQLSGEPRLGTRLSATTGMWASDREITQYAYLWLRCDANGNNCHALHGYYVASKYYDLTDEDLGKTIRVRVFARNADGTTESSNSAATAVIAKHPPVNTTPPTLTGDPQVGQVLRASTGTWASDLPIEQYAYLWLRCDANGNDCHALYGYAIANDYYRLRPEDVGHQIRVRVWARNGEGGTDSPNSPATPAVIA